MKMMEYGSDGETILLLHGGGLNWWSYRAVAERLAGRFHVVLPVLDGHAGADAHFSSIEENAARVIETISQRFGGSVLLLGGLSLGAQIAAEILAERPDICRYALLESAAVIPDALTHALIDPTFAASYGLIGKRWFSRLQFRSLGLPEALFAEYYRDTVAIQREDYISFLRASTAYAAKPALAVCRARVRIVAGGREQGRILRSAERLHTLLPNSSLTLKEGMRHGEFSILHPADFAEELTEWIDVPHST